MEDRDKPCWECKNLDDMGGCKLNDCINPVWLTEEETERFKCFKADKVAIAYRRVSNYIKKYDYTYTVEDILHSYEKYYLGGWYMSYTTTDVINKHKVELGILYKAQSIK